MTTLDRIRPIISDALTIDPAAITAESTLDSLGADSLDVVSIVSDCEAELGVTLPDEAFDNPTTVADLVAALDAAA